MKIKDMYIINAFFLFFAFACGLFSNINGFWYLLAVLLIPQILAFIPFFLYMRLARVMESCGEKRVCDVEIKPMHGLLIILVSAFVLLFVYNSFFQFSADGFLEAGLLVSVFTSNVMGLSVAVLLAILVCYVI